MKRRSHLPPAAPRSFIGDQVTQESAERPTKGSDERVNLTEKSIRVIGTRLTITDVQRITTDTRAAAGKDGKERSDEESHVDDVWLGEPLEPTTKQPE